MNAIVSTARLIVLILGAAIAKGAIANEHVSDTYMAAFDTFAESSNMYQVLTMAGCAAQARAIEARRAKGEISASLAEVFSGSYCAAMRDPQVGITSWRNELARGYSRYVAEDDLRMLTEFYRTNYGKIASQVVPEVAVALSRSKDFDIDSFAKEFASRLIPRLSEGERVEYARFQDRYIVALHRLVVAAPKAMADFQKSMGSLIKKRDAAFCAIARKQIENRLEEAEAQKFLSLCGKVFGASVDGSSLFVDTG